MGSKLSKSSGASDHVCPVESLAENATEPFLGNMTFYEFNKILSGSCAVFACLVMFLCMFMHATHFSKPNEQSKILKISLLLPFYSIFSFLSVVFPKASTDLAPWLDFIQAISLGAFFLLMGQFVSPSDSQRDLFFAALVVKDKKSPTGEGNGLFWFRRRWVMIFQYPVVALGAAVATDITQAAGVYCEYVSKPYFAKLWINLIRTASLVFAVMAVFSFYKVLKPYTQQHKPLAKLISFKAVVALGFLQGIIFWILSDVHVLNPTAKLTYADLNIGIPNLLTCVEMIPLSLFFLYAYPWSPYLLRNLGQDPQGLPLRYRGGFLGVRAWIAMWNPKETIDAIVFAFRMAMELRRMKKTGGPNAGVGQEYSPLVDQYPLEGGRQWARY